MKLLQEIPGYKRILRTVIQMQISELVDQLAEQTGDECIILVASIPDKSLSQLGTKHGQEYLSSKDDLKTDFLDHCLQKFHEENLNSEQGEEGHASKRTIIDNESTLKSKKRRCPYRKSSITSTDTATNYNVINEHSYQSAMTRINNTQSNESVSQEINASQDVIPTGYSEADNQDIHRENICLLDSNRELVVEDNELMEDRNAGDRRVVPDRKLSGSTNEIFKRSLDSSIDVKRKRKGQSRIPYNDDSEDMGENDTRESEINIKTYLEDKLEGERAEVSTPPKKEQTFISGKALSEDLRTSIIFAIIENGGDVKTGYVPRGVYTKVQRKFSMPATSSVTRIWERYIHEGTVAPKKGK